MVKMTCMTTWSHLFSLAILLMWKSANSNSMALQHSARKARSADNLGSRTNDIAFDLPDLTSSIEIPEGSYQLEAFKSVDNDAIINENGIPRASQLLWVSRGQPMLTKTPTPTNRNVTQIFHLSSRGFYTYITMLTKAHRQHLAKVASVQYKLNISSSQIVNLILSQFECSIFLHDDAHNRHLLFGTVTDFYTFPLRMDFEAREDSVERQLFNEVLANTASFNHLRLTCRMAASGRVVLINTLSISSSQVQQIGLDTKLFGPSSDATEIVYVNRQQTSILASEMYSALNIIEDYEMPESSFSQAFVEGLISQVATNNFAFVPIGIVLSNVSKYAFDFSRDLQPDVIKRELGEILRVESRGGRERIVLDEDNYKAYSNDFGVSAGASVGIKGFGLGLSMKVMNNTISASSNKSFSDQLRELNTASRDYINWEREGERIIPKSLNVARLWRSNLRKNLTFNRVRIHRVEAPFNRNVSLYTHRAIAPTPVLDQINDLETRENEQSQKLDSISAYVRCLTEDRNTRACRLLSDKPRDCADIKASGVTSSGVYTVYVEGVLRPIRVYCDMTTDGGGWLVFQRRQDGSEDFYMNWTDYAEGFGNPGTEHWLGNEKLHWLTSSGTSYRLRVDLGDFSGNSRYAEYSKFIIASAGEKYKLESLGNYSGDAGDSLTYHVGQKFSTPDQDNDNKRSSACAVTFKGAWWYDGCHQSNLNGKYLSGNHDSFADGVNWRHWLGYRYSLKFSEMKLRPS